MNIAVVGYPNLDELDRRWVESFRARYDPQVSRIGVHFTLVFPMELASIGLESEIAAVARITQPVSFIIRRTEVVRDALNNGCSVFLVPDEGSAEIATLHNSLYAGALHPYQRLDIPFLPHMTVGATPDVRSARRLAEELNVRSRIIRGIIDKIELVEVGTSVVKSLVAYALGSAERVAV
jgi:2'-5' RNA ligase